MSRFPSKYNRYVEPFVGSGAVFFAAGPPAALLSDLNEDLIATYRAIRDSVEDVIIGLEALSQDAETYYALRSERPTDLIRRAVRFVYLNRSGFNGIWRVNRKGQYNVPYGKRPRRDLVEGDTLRAASKLLAKAELEAADFSGIISQCGRGDVIYADPPYTVRHENNGFRKYNEILFSWEDQERLAAGLRRAAVRGAAVVVSNAHHPAIRSLYKGFDEVELNRVSCVAASVKARTPVSESVFVLLPSQPNLEQTKGGLLA